MRKSEFSFFCSLLACCIALGCLSLSDASSSMSPSGLGKMFTACLGIMGSPTLQREATPPPQPICEIDSSGISVVPNKKGPETEDIAHTVERQETLQATKTAIQTPSIPDTLSSENHANAPPLRNGTLEKCQAVEEVNTHEGSTANDANKPSQSPNRTTAKDNRNNKPNLSKSSAKGAQVASAHKGSNKDAKLPKKTKPTQLAPSEGEKSEGTNVPNTTFDWKFQPPPAPCRDQVVDWRDSDKCTPGGSPFASFRLHVITCL
jgi:hypothetical protein